MKKLMQVNVFQSTLPDHTCVRNKDIEAHSERTLIDGVLGPKLDQLGTI